MATDFQNQVWQKTRLIPQGKVITYKILARSLGKPKASRAVANALNKNPQLLKIPCHRVVRSNGGVGGYIRGQKEKVRLLKKEGLKIEKGKIKNFEKCLYKFNKN